MNNFKVSRSLSAATNRAVGHSPCYGCQERFPGCGANCKQYTEWKEKRSAIYGEIYRRESRDMLVEGYKYERRGIVIHKMRGKYK